MNGIPRPADQRHGVRHKRDGLEFAAGGAQASGDWCEVIAISEQAVALTVGDVSGHGEAVAGTMAAMRASVAFGK